MKTVAPLAGWIVVTCFITEALGHGSPVQVNVSDGRLTVAHGLSLSSGYVTLASDPHEDAAFDFAPNQKLRSVYPGYDIAGVTAPAALQFEIIARPDFSSAGSPLRWLWYWSTASQSVSDVPNDATFNTVPLFGSGLIQARQFSLIAGPTLTMANPIGPYLGADQHLLVYELQDYAPGGTGAYGIFARLTSDGLDPSVPFLLLFRYGAAPEEFEAAAEAISLAAMQPGDFNHDDVVDAADYTVWRDGLGSSYDFVDYMTWNDRFGVSVGGAGSGAARCLALPEPAAIMLVVSAALVHRRAGRAAASRCLSTLRLYDSRERLISASSGPRPTIGGEGRAPVPSADRLFARKCRATGKTGRGSQNDRFSRHMGHVGDLTVGERPSYPNGFATRGK